MKKKLSEMTLEELWQLFPIILTEPNTEWAEWFEEEKALLESVLRQERPIIRHIGSTSVPSIFAKPIVDILVEFETSFDMKGAVEKSNKCGYIIMSNTQSRISLNKGYTEDGFAERVFHLHFRLKGDNDELYFRDYLRENPEIAKEYEALKRSLWKQYEHDRDGYTDSKTEFVRKYTQIAKKLYGKKY